MKTINGKYHYQVKDLIEDLKDFPQDSVVYAVGHDREREKPFFERCIYNTVETADPGEVYLYLGDDRQNT